MAKRKGGGGASRRGSHRLSDCSGCRRRLYYSQLGYQPLKRNFYMDFGTLLHTGMAYHYAPRMSKTPQWYLDYPDRQAALVEDSMGYDDRIRKVEEIMQAYERWSAGDPWEVLSCEEEFETTVGTVDPQGDDEPGFTIEYKDARTGEQRTREFPTLNEELLTCRPDMIVLKNGYNWIVDTKTGGTAKNGSGRLPVMNTKIPDYSYGWQAMFNLTVVRATGVQVEGFLFNRVKRDPPYDFDRPTYEVNSEMYSAMPAAIRQAVKEERERTKAVLSAQSVHDIIPSPWECSGCKYSSVCYADSDAEREYVLLTDFVQDEPDEGIKAA